MGVKIDEYFEHAKYDLCILQLLQSSGTILFWRNERVN